MPEPILICNVSPSPAVVHSGPLGEFVVPGKPPGDTPYAALRIPENLRQGEDLGRGKLKRSLEVDPLAFANECTRPREHRGFFVSVGAPTEKQVHEATLKMRAFYGEQMLKGDELAATNSFSLITRQMREACSVLGEKRSWADSQNHVNKKPCPACRTVIDPASAVCAQCGAVLDAEKAAKYGLAVPAHMLAAAAAEADAEADEPEQDQKPGKGKK